MQVGLAATVGDGQRALLRVRRSPGEPVTTVVSTAINIPLDRGLCGSRRYATTRIRVENYEGLLILEVE